MDDMDGHRFLFVCLKHGLETPGTDMGGDLVGLEARQAPACDCGIDDGIIGIAGEAGGHRNANFGLLAELPFRTAKNAVAADEPVGCQVLRNDRFTVPVEIVG